MRVNIPESWQFAIKGLSWPWRNNEFFIIDIEDDGIILNRERERLSVSGDTSMISFDSSSSNDFSTCTKEQRDFVSVMVIPFHRLCKNLFRADDLHLLESFFLMNEFSCVLTTIHARLQKHVLVKILMVHCISFYLKSFQESQHVLVKIYVTEKRGGNRSG